MSYNRKLAADCRQRNGPLFDHIDDLSVAKDLEAIRVALGKDKLTYYGVSHGTLIGQQYAEMYPQRRAALRRTSSSPSAWTGRSPCPPPSPLPTNGNSTTDWLRSPGFPAPAGRPCATASAHNTSRIRSGRLQVHGAPPLLMVGALHDPATPYVWQTDVAGQLPTATLLTYDGWGHGQYFKSLCVDDAIDDYLISMALPVKGTHCPAAPPAGS